MKHVAVIDIGKTNAKLALVDLTKLEEIAVITRPNLVLDGPPYPHFDTEGHKEFLLASLRDMHRNHGIDAISITTHGASAVLLDEHGDLACPVLDYEFDGPETVSAQYDAIRPDFALTGSPRLGVGLNVGAQLHWQSLQDETLFERTAFILTYPQYWAYWLSGVAATDVTSLGCHTDLWIPNKGQFSSLVKTLGIQDKIAPARQSGDILGPIRTNIAKETGLEKTTPVLCGIHDSNASLYPYLIDQEGSFSVVSTGTWVVSMTMNGNSVTLDPDRDTLINVNAFGAPVPSARFMGGREYEIISDGHDVEPTRPDIAAVLASNTMLLPAVEQGTGPFKDAQAIWTPEEPDIGSCERAAALAFYLALMTWECLEMIGHKGEIIVEGAFARNSTYLAMLAAVSSETVRSSASATGTSIGAAMLFDGAQPLPKSAPVAPLEGAQTYIIAWQRAARRDLSG